VPARIILGQLPDLLGAQESGPFALAKAWDLLLHLGRTDVAAMLAGLSALGLLVILQKTRAAAYHQRSL
jgi:SulP family sulfate permease